ncbi:S41 family peptidase [Patescibacteria group bacterium]
MTSKAKFQRFLITILIAISFFYGGYYYGKRGYEFEVKKNPPQIKVINRNPGDQEVDFELFWRVWDLVQQDYLERPVDGQTMLYGAISGMVESLGDPYTAFLPPQINEAVTDSLNSTYQGIGAELGLKDGLLVIVAPLDGSPAKDAGIKAGDAILKIEGESTAGITITEAVAKIRGNAGTISTLEIGREGEASQEIKIKRGVIKIDSVTWEDKGDGTAYIRISRFGQDTNEEWEKVVKEIVIQMDELDAIVLDLRGNPGGYMLSAIHIAGEFFSNKTVLIQQSATGEEIDYPAKRKLGQFKDVPGIFILVDEGSASASEILAAALQKHVKATLIGQKTFGKGTIQDAKDFEDGSGIHITTNKWLTPAKAWVHGEGIEPDIEIEITKEDIENENDTQLNKALELASEI